MTRHYNERAYQEARAAVLRYDLPELLRLLDDLYGRENLRYGDDTEAVRAEALRQLDREWTMPARDSF